MQEEQSSEKIDSSKNIYMWKEKRSKIDNLSFHLSKLEKEEEFMLRANIKREIKKWEQKAVEDQCRSQRIKKKYFWN